MGQRDLRHDETYHVLAFWADEAEERAVFAYERGEAAESVEALLTRFPHAVTPIWAVGFSVQPPLVTKVWTCAQGMLD